jgi:hypothetical protein
LIPVIRLACTDSGNRGSENCQGLPLTLVWKKGDSERSCNNHQYMKLWHFSAKRKSSQKKPREIVKLHDLPERVREAPRVKSKRGWSSTRTLLSLPAGSLVNKSPINNHLLLPTTAPCNDLKALLLIRLGRDACRRLPPCFYYCFVNSLPAAATALHGRHSAPIILALANRRGLHEIQVRRLRHSRYSNQTYCIMANFLCLIVSQGTQMLISVDAVRSSGPSIQRPY